MNCKFLRGAPENKRLVIPIRIGTRGGRAVLSNLRNNLRVERWPDSGAKRSFRRQWGRAIINSEFGPFRDHGPRIRRTSYICRSPPAA